MGEIQKATDRTAVPVPAPGSSVAVQQHAPQVAVTHQRSLEAKVAYARTLAGSGLLPRAYQKNPPNVLFALEYGETLGISSIATMMGVHVIDNKPCASAGLISGLVQRAGHRLRVKGDDKTATCEITRADDPTYTFTATWTMERAVKAGLTGKQVWKNYPAAMLRARAITECARAAASDVLYGLAYTPEELGADAMDYNPDDINAPAQPEVSPAREELKKIAEEFERLGVTNDERLETARLLVDREFLTSSDELDDDERQQLITELQLCTSKDELTVMLTERQALA